MATCRETRDLDCVRCFNPEVVTQQALPLPVNGSPYDPPSAAATLVFVLKAGELLVALP